MVDNSNFVDICFEFLYCPKTPFPYLPCSFNTREAAPPPHQSQAYPRPTGFAMKGKSKAEMNNTDAKLKKRGSATVKVSKRQSKKQKKAAKDPNKPKRPPSAFFVFMDEFRQEFKRDNPDNKAVSAVGKAAGARWKSMSDAEKAPYAEKAEKKKSDYNKNMDAYNRRLEGTNVEEKEESDEKSRSEVNDDEEDDEETGEEEEEDD